MPYTSIPTLSNGNVLNASHLNTLSANQEFLYALANQPNIPFSSYRDTIALLVHPWDTRHKNRYLHYKITAASNWDYCRIFWNGVKLAGNEAGATTFSGYYDLTSWAGLPNLLGAWTTATGYDDNPNGDGTGGNDDDGDVVTNGGSYYVCTNSHTSGASTEPGVGASWTSYWELLTLPAVNTFCTIQVDVNFTGATEVTVEYLIETDSTSL